MADAREALLKKVYYDDCPGCKMDRNKENQGIPYKEFTYVWIVTLCNALPISSLFPFLYLMIRDIHIAKRVEDIGYYAGFVGSSYMFGRALTSVFWGVVADKFGRKPVIMIATASMVIFNTLFGLSTSFWMALSVRFLLGATNPLIGIMKAYASEVCRKEYQALGLSLISTSWGVGLVIGPALGGILAQPAEKFPNIFSRGSLFERFPYFLPCLCTSAIAFVVFIASFWLPETLHNHRKTYSEEFDLHKSEEASLSWSDRTDLKVDIPETEGVQPRSDESLLKNWPLMSSVIAYCVFSFHDTAYVEIFSLWAVSPPKYGGIGYSTDKLGEVLAISGCGLFLFQFFVYPLVERIFGSLPLSRISAVLNIAVLSSYCFIAKLSGIKLFLLLSCASLVKNVLSVSIGTGLFVLQNNAVPAHQRGAANGIAMTGMSFINGFGPAIGGFIFSWGEDRLNASFLPGAQMVFFTLNVVEFIGLLMIFKPFLAQSTRDD